MNKNEKIEKKNKKSDKLLLFFGTTNGLLFGTKDIFCSNERMLFNKIRFDESITESTLHLIGREHHAE